MEPRPTVFVFDDDPQILDSVRKIAESVSLGCETYSSGEEFLAVHDSQKPGCVVVDLRMPGLSGLDLQQELRARNSPLPLVFITGHGEVPSAVRALKGGAIDFIEKPFSAQLLLDRIREAVETNLRAKREEEARKSLATRLSQLTSREREVLELVVAGKPNREIAAKLGIGQKTVEFHRARLMKKMEVKTAAALIRLVSRSQAGSR